MPTILITGAARGVGFHLAKQALADGWDVIGTVRTPEAQVELSDALAGIAVLQFDVLDHEKIDSTVRAMFRPIDVVVNNAGIIGPVRQSTLEMDFDGFAETLAVNTIAPLKIAQTFHPHLKAGNNARLINISSQMGGTDNFKSDRIAYRSSKAALNKITQALATDLKSDGVCCVSVHPGWVQTDMGGSAADISPQMSALGIFKLIKGLTIENTGRFYNWDGSERVW